MKTPGKYQAEALSKEELSDYLEARGAANLITALNSQIRIATDDLKLPGDVKRRMIDGMYEEMVVAARDAVRVIRSGAKPMDTDEREDLRQQLKWPVPKELAPPPE